MNLKKFLALVLLTFSLTACVNESEPSTSKEPEEKITEEIDYDNPEVQKQIEAEITKMDAEEAKKIHEDYKS